MRTVIFGANGQLGRDLRLVFAPHGDVQGWDLPDLDLAEPDAASRAVEAFQPDLVINAAAFTDVDGAEDRPEEAFRTNELGAKLAAEAAARANAAIVYYSTDYVFAGDKTTPYLPDDPIAPKSVYGQSKAAGERAVRAATPNHCILRTAWLYGPGGNNFPEKMLRLAASRPSLRLVEDEIGSPTHTYDLAQATLAAVKACARGTFHAVNAGACSRYEFAREVFRLAGVHIETTPCRADEFPSKAARPRYSVLDTTALEAATGRKMRPWQDALAHYMQRREATS